MPRHRLISSIKPQVDAVREGLAVFLHEGLRATLRKCSSVSDIQLLISGAAEIDVDDWEASAEYAGGGGFDAQSPLARWFWQVVREMGAEQRTQLLHFCTGSARVPATGFGSLMGYHGQQQRFRLQRLADEDTARLPTASTCFNTLRLPPYPSEAELRGKLRVALAGSQGFDEGAVAE